MRTGRALALALALSGLGSARATVFFELEGGAAFSGYNDVRIPPDTGTRFSLDEELDADPAAFARLRVGWRFGDRHALLALAAPLRLTYDGRFTRPVSYQGVEFAAGEAIEALYRFDSYRMTYRYRVWTAPRARLELGATAKIRAAEIRLEGGGRRARKTDTGFVPLVAFAFDWRWAPGVGLAIEGDALASPGGQGRAEDVLAALRLTVARDLDVLVGYRLLEGGADVETVYNFALVHYASVGLRWQP